MNDRSGVIDLNSSGTGDHLCLGTQNTERLRITSAGVVGINTDVSNNPSGSKLVVGGRIQSNAGGYWFAGANGAEDGWHVQDSGGNLLVVESNVAERLRIRGAGPHLLLGTGGDATYNEITETSSNAGLVIGSSSMTNGGIVIRTGTSGTGRIYFADNSGSDAGRNVGRIGYYHSNNSLVLGAGGSDTMTMFAGNVRISGAGLAAGTSQSPLAVSNNSGTISAFFGAQTSVTGLTASQYSSAIRFNGADVAWGDIAYFPNGDNEYGSFRFGRHGSTISSYPSASIGVKKVYTTGGIDFKTTTEASGMSSELFDDYEEGTFTPTLITNGGSGSVGSYGQRAASYTKIGRKVTCFGRIAITNKGTLSGGIAIGDLPFTIADTVSTTGIDGGGVLNYFSGVNSSHYTDFIGANPIQATTYFVLYRGNQVGALSGMDQGHIDNNFDCRFTITYFTAS